MTLRDDIHDAVRRSSRRLAPTSVDRIAEAIWTVLEDQIGTVQERLMEQLTAARTELAAARRREDAYRESIAELQSALVEATREEEAAD